MASGIKLAMPILTADSDVKRRGVMNIFGGIARSLPRKPRALSKALTEVEIDVPLVIRLQGTNADIEGARILENLGIEFAVDRAQLKEAAEAVDGLSATARHGCDRQRWPRPSVQGREKRLPHP